VPDARTLVAKLRNEAEVIAMSVLVIAEHDNQSVKSATLNTVAARRRSAAISSCSLPLQLRRAAKAAVAIAGVRKVLAADAPHYRDSLRKTCTAGHRASPAPTRTFSCPRIPSGKISRARRGAARRRADLRHRRGRERDTFVRPIYAGNALATVQSKDKIRIITVRRRASTRLPHTAARRGRNPPGRRRCGPVLARRTRAHQSEAPS